MESKARVGLKFPERFTIEKKDTALISKYVYYDKINVHSLYVWKTKEKFDRIYLV